MSRSENPYVGPGPFLDTQKDRKRFFGRDIEAQAIITLIFSNPATLVYAESGAGKTSIFNAKIIPDLLKEGFDVLPLMRLQGSMEDYSSNNVFLNNAINNIPNELIKRRGLSLKEFIAERPPKYIDDDVRAPLVLVFDQFEEIFNLFPQNPFEQREDFFKQIGEALEEFHHLRIVFIIREEYVSKLDNYQQHLPQKLRARYFLRLMSPVAALKALTMPLEGTEYSFSKDSKGSVARILVDEIRKLRLISESGDLEQVSGQLVEPVQLQVVAWNLWQNAHNKTKVFDENYIHKFGNVDNALADFYESNIALISKHHGLAESEIRDWFEYKLLTPIGTRDNVYELKGFVVGLSIEVVKSLEDCHLIRSYFHAGGFRYELIHDRFIKPILDCNKSWSDAHGREQNLLANSTNLWLTAKAEGNEEEYLLGGKTLELAQKYADENKESVTQDEQTFLNLSTRRDSSKRKRALVRQKRRIAIFLVISVFAIVAAIFALIERTKAVNASKLATKKSDEAINAKKLTDEAHLELQKEHNIVDSLRIRSDSLRLLANASVIKAQYEASVANIELLINEYQKNREKYKQAYKNGSFNEAILWLQESLSSARKIALDRSRRPRLSDDELALQYLSTQTNGFEWQTNPKLIPGKFYFAGNTAWLLDQNEILYYGKRVGNSWSFETPFGSSYKCFNLIRSNNGQSVYALTERDLVRLLPDGRKESLLSVHSGDYSFKWGISISSITGRLFLVQGNQLFEFDPIEQRIVNTWKLPFDANNGIWNMVVHENLRKAVFQLTDGDNKKFLSIVNLKNGVEKRIPRQGSVYKNCLRTFGNYAVYITNNDEDLEEKIIIDLKTNTYSKKNAALNVREILDMDKDGFTAYYTNGKLVKWDYQGDFISDDKIDDVIELKFLVSDKSVMWGADDVGIFTINEKKKTYAIRFQEAKKVKKVSNNKIAIIGRKTVEIRSTHENELLEVIDIKSDDLNYQEPNESFFNVSGDLLQKIKKQDHKVTNTITIKGDRFLHIPERNYLIASTGDGLFLYNEDETKAIHRLMDGNPESLTYTFPYVVGAFIDNESHNIQLVQFDVRDFETKKHLVLTDRPDVDYVSFANGELVWGYETGQAKSYEFKFEKGFNKDSVLTISQFGEDVSVIASEKDNYWVARENGSLEYLKKIGNGYFPIAKASDFGGRYINTIIPLSTKEVIVKLSDGSYGKYIFKAGTNYDEALPIPKASDQISRWIVARPELLAYPIGSKIIVESSKYDWSTELSVDGTGVSGFRKIQSNPRGDKILAIANDGSLFVWSGYGEQTRRSEAAVYNADFVSNDEILVYSRSELFQRFSHENDQLVALDSGIPVQFESNVPSIESNEDFIFYFEENSYEIFRISRNNHNHKSILRLDDQVRVIKVEGNVLYAGGTEQVFVIDTKSLKVLNRIEIGAVSLTTNYYIRSIEAISEKILALGSQQAIYLCENTSTKPFMTIPLPDYVWSIEKTSNNVLEWKGYSYYGSIKIPDFNDPLAIKISNIHIIDDEITPIRSLSPH